MHRGFYPKLFVSHLDATTYYRDYVQTYLERDVRQILNVKDLRSFQIFLRLCAGRVGQLFNASQLANEVGVSSHTIKNWLNVLEASFIITLLSPYYRNVGKRLVKSPKIYSCDTGLLSYLLDINTPSQLERDPLRGHIFENMMVMDAIKENNNYGKGWHLYFYRDAHQNEVDLVFRKDDTFVAVEIKISSTFHHQFLDGIDYFKHILRDEPCQGTLIYGGPSQLSGIYKMLNYRDYFESF